LDKHVKLFAASTINKPGQGKDTVDRENGFGLQVLNNYKTFGQKAITLIECLLPTVPKSDSCVSRSTTPLGQYLDRVKEEIISLALKKVFYSLRESEAITAT